MERENRNGQHFSELILGISEKVRAGLLTETENKKGHLKRDLILLLSGTFLTCFVSVSAIHHDADCVGKAEFDGEHKLISACLTSENIIIIHKSGFPPITLPKETCRLTEIWAPIQSDNKITFVGYGDKGYSYRVGNVNVETGEFETGVIHYIPAGFYGNGTPNPNLWCEK